MLEIKNISFSYPDGKKVFENFSLSFKTNERVCIKAPSGGGKSTLLRLICGLEKPSDGKIEIGDNNLITYVPQYDDLFEWYTVKKNVALASDDKTAEKWLCKFGLEDCLNKFPSQLSGGMRKRVSLARAVGCEPEILLIDEVFGGLDEKLKSDIMKILKDYFVQKLIIFATHNVSEIEDFATRVVEL